MINNYSYTLTTDLAGRVAVARWGQEMSRNINFLVVFGLLGYRKIKI